MTESDSSIPAPTRQLRDHLDLLEAFAAAAEQPGQTLDPHQRDMLLAVGFCAQVEAALEVAAQLTLLRQQIAALTELLAR